MPPNLYSKTNILSRWIVWLSDKCLVVRSLIYFNPDRVYLVNFWLLDHNWYFL